MGMEVALLLRRYPYHILVILYRGPIGMTPPRMRVGSHLNSALRPHFSCRLFADDSWITFAWLFIDAFEEARGGRVSPSNLLVFFFLALFFCDSILPHQPRLFKIVLTDFISPLIGRMRLAGVTVFEF